MVTADDVSRLLAAGAGAVLVVVEGRVAVVDAPELDSEPYRGALQIISHEELVRVVGKEQLSEHELREQAAVLDTAVSELGG